MTTEEIEYKDNFLRMEREYRKYRETHVHYGFAALLLIVGVLIVAFGVAAEMRNAFKPIIRIQDKKALIDCPDGSTQWAPVPQCKKIK